MKKILSCVILAAMCLVLWSGSSNAFKTAHTYFNGKVESISGNLVVIEGTTFQIDPKCRVVTITEKDRAYYENPAKLRDVARGDTVTVKRVGNVLYEIMIERWRR